MQEPCSDVQIRVDLGSTGVSRFADRDLAERPLWICGAACASLTALRAGPPFSWGVTSGGPPGERPLSKDGTRADSTKDFCRLVGGVYYAGNDLTD